MVRTKFLGARVAPKVQTAFREACPRSGLKVSTARQNLIEAAVENDGPDGVLGLSPGGASPPSGEAGNDHRILAKIIEAHERLREVSILVADHYYTAHPEHFFQSLAKFDPASAAAHLGIAPPKAARVYATATRTPVVQCAWPSLPSTGVRVRWCLSVEQTTRHLAAQLDRDACIDRTERAC